MTHNDDSAHASVRKLPAAGQDPAKAQFTGPPARPAPLWQQLYDKLAQGVDHRIGWDRLPQVAGLAVLGGVRDILRRQNLHDTNVLPTVNPPQPQPYQPWVLTQRTADGSWNDLDYPAMGMAGSRFGRNVPLGDAVLEDARDVLSPNPRTISRALMTRNELIPAPGGNALIATWLQFMLHDWVSHGKSPTDNPWVLPLDEDDDWPDRPLLVMRTPPDPTRPDSSEKLPPTHVNVLTHWWDGSQIYGTSAAEQDFVREHAGGKLRLENGLPPYPKDPQQDPTRKPGFWLGLATMQTLFTLEHNAIAEHLGEHYPTWSDEELFQRARLINAALLAKIHTVEWTPAVISHPTTVTALHANWYGLAGQNLHNVFGRLSSNEVVSGIPGSETDHFGVPFSLTEEFVAVYRMHPLIPDTYDFRRASDNGQTLGKTEFDQLTGPAAINIMDKLPLLDILYTLGTMNAGLVTLHNFPRGLQTMRRPDNGHFIDLAATDILRNRELGVPRYTKFRRLLNLSVPATFDELTDNPTWAKEISDVYEGDIDRVDLTVGMFAETRPEGFAFSDTAFRIFILMASRRLNSDRFFTRHFNSNVYTPQGLAWIDENTMTRVLLRHCPELRTALRDSDNAFGLWHVTEAPAAGSSDSGS
jgi:hypothetical protein